MKINLLLLFALFPVVSEASDRCGTFSSIYKAVGLSSCTGVSPISPDGNQVNSNSCTSCKGGGGQVAVASPVNASSGAMWHEQVDFVVPGRTPVTSLKLFRTYTAVNATVPGGFGPRWHHNYETRLYFVPIAGTVLRDILWVDESGGPFLFKRQYDGSYKTPSGNQFVLTEFSDRYELRKADRTTYYFSKSSRPGLIYQIKDPHGEAIDLSYDGSGRLSSVSAPFAGSVNFTYNSQGLITQVLRVRDNLAYNYTYSSDGKLASVTDFAGKTYSFTYNQSQPNTPAQGLLASITDPLGRVLTFNYDDQGRASNQQEPGGGSWSFVYGDHKTFVKGPNGYTTKYFFDENLRETKRVLPDATRMSKSWANGNQTSELTDFGGPTRFDYDANGNLRLVQRPEDSAPTLLTYDQNFNKPILVQPPVGASTQYTLDSNTGDVLQMSRGGLSLGFTRDSFGNLLSVNNGRTTYSDQRDANGLLTRKFDLHNPETRSYDARGRLAQRQFQSGRVLAYAYDDYDRVISIVDSAGPSQTFIYDAVGRKTQETKSVGGTSEATSYVYDDHDRLVSTTDALNRTTTFQYDPVHVIDKPKSITDPAGRVTYLEYDKRQRLVKKTDANGALTSYTWDQRSNLTSVTDAQGGVTTYSYDLSDRKIREMRQSVAGSSAAQRVTLYFYGAADYLVREVTKSGTGGADRTIVYDYDPLDRLVKRVVQREGSSGPIVEDDSTFSYENQLDSVLMKTAVNGVASLGFTSEAAPPFAGTGFSVAATQSGNPLGLIEGSFDITRDVTGEIASVSKDGTTLFTRNFDPAGRLSGVTTPGGFSTTIGYDGFGRKTSVAHSDGSSGSFTWDLLNRLTAVSWTGPTPISEQLTYDPLTGNISNIQRENGAYTLAHDAIGQIVSSTTTGSANYNRNWSYSPVGDRLADSQNGAGTYLNHFLVANGMSSFLADPDGFGDVIRETSGTVVKNYAYRADGKIAAFQSGSISVNFFYDPLNRLVAKTVNDSGNAFTQSFIHLDKQNGVLLGKAGDNTVTTYLDDLGFAEHLGEVKNGVGRGYIADHLGSVLNSAPGGNSKSYGLFGESTASPATSPAAPPIEYAFAGYNYRREDGGCDTDNRVYSPSTGRWLSQDPIGINARDPNYYRYVMNNPLSLTDPTGLDFTICSRPLNMSTPNVDPFKHYYIRFDDGSTISYGVDENGNPTELKEPGNPQGERCGGKIASSGAEDQMMKDWANQHYNHPYDPLGYNCKTFVGDVTTKPWRERSNFK